jgi:serine/threonine-protein kinase 24/25/MST4
LRQAASNTTIVAGTLRSNWNFDETMRSTMKGSGIQLDLAELSDDDYEDDPESWAGRTVSEV